MNNTGTNILIMLAATMVCTDFVTVLTPWNGVAMEPELAAVFAAIDLSLTAIGSVMLLMANN